MFAQALLGPILNQFGLMQRQMLSELERILTTVVDRMEALHQQIAEVPRTLSGKVLEVPVKRILMGTSAEKAASRESLANPEALDYFVERASTS